MAGLRSININSIRERYADRAARAPSPRVIQRANLDGLRAGVAPGLAPEEIPTGPQLDALARASNDAAGRKHLETILEDLGSEQMLAVTSPERPEVVPDLALRGESYSPDLNSNAVTYQQAPDGIPVFGARVVVDVDPVSKSLVAVNGKLAAPPLADSMAQLSPADAWSKLLGWAGGDQSPQAPPTPPALNWYVDEAENYHLTYRFKAVPVVPSKPVGDDDMPFSVNACVRHSARRAARAYDYFVDAKDGTVRYFFSSAPHFIPSPMRGEDCFGESRDFFGENINNAFVLRDRLRNIETFDYGFADLDQQPSPPPVPASPMSFPAHDVANASPAAVSAHWHATLVFDFFNHVLKRNGIDDKGMKLVSVVNVYASGDGMPAPQWPNAAWWQNIMWYGQEQDGGGQLVSYSKHLDVIAHELTHGVTSSSSNLVYRDLPGALNESFSDIFGIFVANWYPQQPNPIQGWNWEIGAGLGQGGGPLRDFANPAAAGQPSHMNQYQPLPPHKDNGGVHIYSGIHNKAVHGLLTAMDANGDPVLPTVEAALLLYLTLIRLTPTSNFSDARRTLLTVAGVYYANHPNRDARLNVIRDAYSAVGIA